MKAESKNQVNSNHLGLQSSSYLNQSLLKSNNSALHLQRKDKQETDSKRIFNKDSFGDYNNNIESRNNIVPVPVVHVMNQCQNHQACVNYNDPRIEYVLNCLNLMSFNQKVKINQMNFNDLLFLSREDFDEIGLSMVHRNRLKRFCEVYQQFAIDYSYNEIMLFFKKNRHFVFKDAEMNQNAHDISICNSRNLNKSNNDNNESPSSKEELRYFQQFKKKIPSGNRYNNEVFIPIRNTQMRIRAKSSNNIEIESSASKKKESSSNKSIIPDNQRQIEHIELQFSRSFSKVVAVPNKTSINRTNGTPQNNIYSNYQKLSREVDEYLTNISNNKEIAMKNSEKKCQCALIKSKKNRMMTCSGVSSSELPSEYNIHNNNSKQSKHKIVIPTGYSRSHNSNTTTKNNNERVVKANEDHSNHKLNRNRSLTDLHKGNNNNRLNSIEKLTECIKRKEWLRFDLKRCKNKIKENLKLLKKLEEF